MDFGLISATAVSLISPYLTKLAKGAVHEAGSIAWDKAKEVLESIRAKFADRPTEALAKLEEAPEDPEAQAAVTKELQAVMAEDETLAGELEKLLKEAASAGADTVFNTNIAGKVGKVINIGTNTGDLTIN